ncbi:MAG: hypothetical protein ACJAYE_002659 [Candidatus Azotimanducaceae bacterium]
MITLSEFAVIGVLEVFAILSLTICGLMIYNHRLHKRRGSLATQLTQLKDTTRFLLEKANSFNKVSYESFLGDEIINAKETVSGFFENEELHFRRQHTPQSKADIIRYLLLEAELAAAGETDTEAKQAKRQSRLMDIVIDFERASGFVDSTDTIEGVIGSTINEADLKQKWGYLCDAAVSLVHQRTLEAAENLIEVVRVINADLNLGELDVPAHSENKGASSQTSKQLRLDSDRSKDVISKLLTERNAAEAQVNIKADELESLQRFLKESDVCLNVIESELRDAQGALAKSKQANDQDPAEMQALIQRFSRESCDMLMCIGTLEKENSDLRNQLGL